MQIHLTVPLAIKALIGTKLSLLPVIMSGIPTSNSAVFAEFLKTQGKRIEIDNATADKVQAYMRKHKTEAVSDDGVIAFTICGNALVECLPDDAERLFEALKDEQ